MALVAHLPPHVARRLHQAGLLTDTAIMKLERRTRLVRWVWLAIALLFGLAILGRYELMSEPPPATPVIAKQMAQTATP